MSLQPRANAQSEKILFYSLWALLILVVGIWRFWPTTERSPSSVTPNIQMAPELFSLFEGAELKKQTPSLYGVELKVKASYTEKIVESQKIAIGYQLMIDEKTLFRGSAAGVLKPDSNMLFIQVLNPQLVSAKEIYLFLAQ